MTPRPIAIRAVAVPGARRSLVGFAPAAALMRASHQKFSEGKESSDVARLGLQRTSRSRPPEPVDLEAATRTGAGEPPRAGDSPASEDRRADHAAPRE